MNPGPAEPKADMLPSKPTRRTFRRKPHLGFLCSEIIHRPRPGSNLGSRGEYDNHWTIGVDSVEVDMQDPCLLTRRTGLVSRGVWNFNHYRETKYVSFVCILSCVVSDDDSDIPLITDSGRPTLMYKSNVLVHYLLLSVEASDPVVFGSKFRKL